MYPKSTLSQVYSRKAKEEEENWTGLAQAHNFPIKDNSMTKTNFMDTDN